jgi:hypothetical protein
MRQETAARCLLSWFDCPILSLLTELPHYLRFSKRGETTTGNRSGIPTLIVLPVAPSYVRLSWDELRPHHAR